jgi:cephalosporin-C deacetylase-like acetyl esterase
MYGRTPTEKIKVTYTVLSENPNYLNGKATGKQVKFIFTNGTKKVEAFLLLVLPNRPKGKVPVFIVYNYMGNHSTCFEPDIVYSSTFAQLREPGHREWERGCQANRWSYDKIIDRGYGVATMFYEDIYHDDSDNVALEQQSIASLFSDYDPDSNAPDRWQALGAWAWGSSRIVDYLETQKRVDSDKIIVMGHSRHGKAALWAGAQDERFKIVISNNSGCCGAALS